MSRVAVQDFGRGTLAPLLRASESPMAMACFLFFTLPPLPPLPERSLPSLARRTARSTLLPAALPYFAIDCLLVRIRPFSRACHCQQMSQSALYAETSRRGP